MIRGSSAQRRSQRRIGAGSLLPALLCAWLPVVAEAGRDYREAQPQQKQQDGELPAPPRQTISLDQAISMAEQRYKARVVRADTTESDGRRYHVLRLLSQEGRVWTVRIDAATGQER